MINTKGGAQVMDPVEEALEWLFSKSENEIVAEVEVAMLYDLFFSIEESE